MTAPPLAISGLALGYGQTRVLQGLDLTLAAGECVALLGASGSGKTSLLRAVAGFLDPQAGSIAIGGRSVFGEGAPVPPEARGVGMVFQDYALFAHMSVAENVAFGIPGLESAARVEELLELVGLAGLSERRPAELSGGQQQRCALARALAPRPSLLLFDEPFANLDAALRAHLARELREILARERAAALVVTHDCHDAFSISDRVAVLGPDASGTTTLLQCASGEEVYRSPATPVVARLGGPFSAIPGAIEGGRLSSPAGEFDVAGGVEGPGLVLARPEELRAVEDPYGPFELLGQHYLGRAHLLRLGAGELEVSVEAASAASPTRRYRLEAQRPLWALPDPG